MQLLHKVKVKPTGLCSRAWTREPYGAPLSQKGPEPELARRQWFYIVG